MSKINNVQKIILTVFAPLVIIIAALGISSEVGRSAFDWDDTWLVWFIALALIGFIEYKLYGNKQ